MAILIRTAIIALKALVRSRGAIDFFAFRALLVG